MKNPRVTDSVGEITALARELNTLPLATKKLANTLSESFSQILLPTIKDIEQAQKDMLNTAQSMAKLGWTLPLHLSPRQTSDLIQQCNAKGQRFLDEWFLNYYEINKAREFKELIKSLHKNRWLDEWHPLLKDGAWAYRRGKYRLVVPTLLMVLEGIVVKLARSLPDKKATHPQKIWGKVTRRSGSIDEVFWKSASVFLCQVWREVDFDKEPPDLINRHWVLHGRRPNIGSQTDALRLFVAIDFIADYLRDVAGAKPKSDAS